MGNRARVMLPQACVNEPVMPLADNQVHVIVAWLDDLAEDQERLSTFLSTEERARAERFIFSRDRERYILRRGLLREMLGGYTGVDPADIRIGCEGRGKPMLIAPLGGPRLHFNLSHTDGLAAYAVARCCPVGVDVERTRAIPDWQELAAEHFTGREQRELFGLPCDRQLEAFFRGWTRKEALLKAMGEGIYEGLRRVEVSLAVGSGASVRAVDGSAELARRWIIAEAPSGMGFIGAIVAQSCASEVACANYRELRTEGVHGYEVLFPTPS